MDVTCNNCRTSNNVPAGSAGGRFKCQRCGAFLPAAPPATGEDSLAVGLIGGAALGAAIGGPVGAIVGGILGAILGKQSKGLG
jgi:outer membrane lipoprotein SlyB